MQISMNQGPGLSERNWLTEGCQPCAWKMMDPICKLLLCPSALYLLCHWLLSKVEILPLLKNNEWLGEIGTLPAISLDCARTCRGSVWFQWRQAWLSSWALFSPFSSLIVSMDVSETTVNLKKIKIHKKISNNAPFFPLCSITDVRVTILVFCLRCTFLAGTMLCISNISNIISILSILRRGKMYSRITNLSG